MVTKATIFIPAQSLIAVPGGKWGEKGEVVTRITIDKDRDVELHTETGGIIFHNIPYIVEYNKEGDQ